MSIIAFLACSFLKRSTCNFSFENSAKILKNLGILRIPKDVELAGLDISAEMLSEQEFKEVEKALLEES